MIHFFFIFKYFVDLWLTLLDISHVVQGSLVVCGTYGLVRSPPYTVISRTKRLINDDKERLLKQFFHIIGATTITETSNVVIKYIGVCSVYVAITIY